MSMNNNDNKIPKTALAAKLARKHQHLPDVGEGVLI